MTQVAEQPGSTAGRLGSVVLDCPDPLELAQFYSALLGLDIDENGDDDWRSLTGPGSSLGFSTLAFRRSEEYVPATWPGTDAQDLHLDLIVEDLSQRPRHRGRARGRTARPPRPAARRERSRLAHLRRPRGSPVQNLPRVGIDICPPRTRRGGLSSVRTTRCFR